MLRAQTSMEITQFGALGTVQGKAIESDAGLLAHFQRRETEIHVYR